MIPYISSERKITEVAREIIKPFHENINYLK